MGIKGVSMSPQEIIQACIDASFTQEQISSLSGVPQGTISRILTGTHADPRNSTGDKLRKFYSAHVDEIRAKSAADQIKSTDDLQPPTGGQIDEEGSK
jgi:transcriptional regulator with XRE-family HTH domain